MNTPVDDFSMQSDIEGRRLKEAVWRRALDVWNKKIYIPLLPVVKGNVTKEGEIVSYCVLICWV